jgi:hypothetical protein
MPGAKSKEITFKEWARPAVDYWEKSLGSIIDHPTSR